MRVHFSLVILSSFNFTTYPVSFHASKHPRREVHSEYTRQATQSHLAPAKHTFTRVPRSIVMSRSVDELRLDEGVTDDNNDDRSVFISQGEVLPEDFLEIWSMYNRRIEEDSILEDAPTSRSLDSTRADGSHPVISSGQSDSYLGMPKTASAKDIKGFRNSASGYRGVPSSSNSQTHRREMPDAAPFQYRIERERSQPESSDSLPM